MEGPLPPSSLRLLVPPLRVLSAAMWKAVHLRNVEHYGRAVEFVSMVTEAVPDILTDRQMRLLTLSLRAKMLGSQQSDCPRSVKSHLDILLPTSSRQAHAGTEALEANFGDLVQRLLEDSKERENFPESTFPVRFGPDFDAALEELFCEFLNKLEERVLIPDFKQTAEWITDTPSLLEEHMQCVTKADDLTVLLRSQLCRCQTARMDSRAPSPSEQRLLSSLLFPASVREGGANVVDSNTPTLPVQGESEPAALQEAVGVQMQDTKCSDAEETPGGKSADMVPDAPAVDGPTSYAASTSAQGPITSSSVLNPPKQRVAHRCTHCGKCFIYRYELLEHQRLHTGENPYTCSQCGKAFRRASDLSSHRRTHCKRANYICIKCSKSFNSVQDKFGHQCVHNVQKHDCSQCGKSFKRIYLLRKHELTHRQDRNFTCRQCGEECASMRDLRSHQKIHPPELANQCTQCGKFLGSATSLTAHELRHRRQKTQICACCGKAFKDKHDLNLHMRSHTGERPFQCSYCGKRFSVSGNLNIHIRTHTGEKPYPCSDCGKAFISAGELQIHRRTHTGERPYKCSVCEKGFTMASKVTVHMRIHTGERPYVCSECGKGFSRGSELKKHAMKHTGDRPYSCPVCARTYICLNHLKRHFKTHSVVQTQTL